MAIIDMFEVLEQQVHLLNDISQGPLHKNLASILRRRLQYEKFTDKQQTLSEGNSSTWTFGPSKLRAMCHYLFDLGVWML